MTSFLHGCNYPWSTDETTAYYGMDFGANIWGSHLGVSTRRAAVQRDFDLEKQQYTDLSAKLAAAGIAENVERARTGEQFSVLYPAGFPSEPTKPVPLRVMLFSIVAGICLGGALMIGREYFDRSIHDVRELRDEFELSVLGEVGHIKAV